MAITISKFDPQKMHSAVVSLVNINKKKKKKKRDSTTPI